MTRRLAALVLVFVTFFGARATGTGHGPHVGRVEVLSPPDAGTVGRRLDALPYVDAAVGEVVPIRVRFHAANDLAKIRIELADREANVIELLSPKSIALGAMKNGETRDASWRIRLNAERAVIHVKVSADLYGADVAAAEVIYLGTPPAFVAPDASDADAAIAVPTSQRRGGCRCDVGASRDAPRSVRLRVRVRAVSARDRGSLPGSSDPQAARLAAPPANGSRVNHAVGPWRGIRIGVSPQERSLCCLFPNDPRRPKSRCSPPVTSRLTRGLRFPPRRGCRCSIAGCPRSRSSRTAR